MRHVKVAIVLDLAHYSTESILKMLELKLLTKEEVGEELRARGMDDYEVLMTIRGWDSVKRAG